MRQKKGLVLRDVCGEKVIIGEGLEAIDFGRLMCLNETAAWLWEKASEMGEFSIEGLAEALFEEFEVTQEQDLQDLSRRNADAAGIYIQNDHRQKCSCQHGKHHYIACPTQCPVL